MSKLLTLVRVTAGVVTTKAPVGDGDPPPVRVKVPTALNETPYHLVVFCEVIVYTVALVRATVTFELAPVNSARPFRAASRVAEMSEA